MTRTRLDTQFKAWTFIIDDDEMFVCLEPFSKFCKRISYSYCERHGYSVNCLLYDSQRFEDFILETSYFARSVYPKLVYHPRIHAYGRQIDPERKIRNNDLATGVCIVFVYVIFALSLSVAVGFQNPDLNSNNY